jgi:hypothetical protein
MRIIKAHPKEIAFMDGYYKKNILGGQDKILSSLLRRG